MPPPSRTTPRPTERPTYPPPSRPSTGTPAATDLRLEAEDEGSGLVWQLIFLLLIFLGGSGALLYFTGFFDQTMESPPAMAEVGQRAPAVAEEPMAMGHDMREIPPPAEPIPEPPQPETLPMEESHPMTETPGPGEAETVAPAPTGAESTQAPYSASIQKDRQGLTITLEGPLESPESLLKETSDSAAKASSDASQAQDRPEADATTPEPQVEPQAEPESVKPEPAPKKKAKRVITHVVVKGDTLWAIAERYVKDPFRYPELARLSGIKDPDLIYPGDTIRIIEK